MRNSPLHPNLYRHFDELSSIIPNLFLNFFLFFRKKPLNYCLYTYVGVCVLSNVRSEVKSLWTQNYLQEEH